MNRKRATILITILILAILGALVYSYFYLLPEGQLPGSGKGFGSFFPRNEGGDIVDVPNDFPNEGQFPGEGGGVIIPNLRHITIEPISGMTTYILEGGTTTPDKTIYRFVERATGHIYDVKEDEIGSVRISNTTIPAVEEVYFLSPDRLVMRYLKDDNETIETFLAAIEKDENGEYEGVEGIFLPQNIQDIAVSDNGEMFYISKTDTGSIGTLYDSETGDSEVIFESLLSEWLPLWGGTNLFLNTKASSENDSHVFRLNSETGSLSKIFGGKEGLSIKPNPFSGRILYSEMEGQRITFAVYNIAERGSNVVSVGTLAEKCAWTEEMVIYCGVPEALPSRELPEAWYQGRVHFTDNIWKIDINTGIFEVVATSDNDAGEELDVWKPEISADGKYFIFMNKRDHTLWSLKVEEDLPEIEETEDQEN